MNIRDLVKQALKKNERKANNRAVSNSLFVDSKVDTLGTLNFNQDEVTLPDGTKKQAAISGSPTKFDLTLKLSETVHYVVNQLRRPLTVDSFGIGYVISRSTGIVNSATKWYVSRHPNHETYYELDVLGISGTTNKTHIRQVELSPNGRHIFVGSVSSGEDGSTLLKFGIIKNFKLISPEEDTHVVQGTVVTFSRTIDEGFFTPAETPDPPVMPGPLTAIRQINANGFYGNICDIFPPFDGPNGQPGSLGGQGTCVTTSTTEQTWTFEPETDSEITSRFSIVPAILIVDGVYIFSNDDTGEPVVDFFGDYISQSFARVFFRIDNYRSDTETSRLIRCGGQCTFPEEELVIPQDEVTEILTSFEQHDYSYGALTRPYVFETTESSSPCTGFDPEGVLVNQGRTVTITVSSGSGSSGQGACSGGFSGSCFSGCADGVPQQFVGWESPPHDGTLGITDSQIPIYLCSGVGPLPIEPSTPRTGLFQLENSNVLRGRFKCLNLMQALNFTAVVDQSTSYTQEADTIQFDFSGCEVTDTIFDWFLIDGESGDPDNSLSAFRGFRAVKPVVVDSTAGLYSSGGGAFIANRPLLTVLTAFSGSNPLITDLYLFPTNLADGVTMKAVDTAKFQGHKIVGSEMTLYKLRYDPDADEFVITGRKLGQKIDNSKLLLDWIMR